MIVSPALIDGSSEHIRQIGPEGITFSRAQPPDILYPSLQAQQQAGTSCVAPLVTQSGTGQNSISLAFEDHARVGLFFWSASSQQLRGRFCAVPALAHRKY